MARTTGKSGFKMRSSNSPLFKEMGSSPIELESVVAPAEAGASQASVDASETLAQSNVPKAIDYKINIKPIDEGKDDGDADDPKCDADCKAKKKAERKAKREKKKADRKARRAERKARRAERKNKN